MKIEIGQFNRLEITATYALGAVLDGGEAGDILLPLQPTPEIGAHLNAFVYLGTDGRLMATLDQPLVSMGQVALLEIIDVTDIGAFADWGLTRDLFIPFAEQQYPLRKGRKELIKVYLDNQNRIAGSSRIDHWIKDDASGLKVGDAVSLVIADKTEMGTKAIINHRCWGLLYENELFRKVRKGDVIEGYVKKIRDGDKIDLSLSRPGFSKDKMADVAAAITAHLEAHGGHMSLTDKSMPQEIYATFGVSKKVFKQALGALYKQRKVSLGPDGVTLI